MSSTVNYYSSMSVSLRRALSLGRKSSVGDSMEGVVSTTDEAVGESAGLVKQSRAKPAASAKRLLGVFGGLERRHSLGGGGKHKLTESVDLKLGGQFASLLDEMDGGKDESPLIKARREEADEADGLGEAAVDLKRTTTVTSMLSQMTTHDDGVGQGAVGESMGPNLVNASTVDIGVGSLKRTLEESEGEEVWYTTSTEEGFVDTNSLLREASIAHKLVGMERKLEVFSGQIRQCVVSAMKMEHLSTQIHRVTSSATKAQMDVESRLSIVAEAVRKDESLAEQVVELESKVRDVRAQLSQLEDDLEQERAIQRELAEARRLEGAQEKGASIRGLVVFVARSLAVPLLVIALSGMPRRV